MKQIISICHSIMKSIYRILPLSGSHKELLKNFCYGKSGGIFKHIQGYQNWQVRQGVLCSLFSNTDSGLSIPDDIPLTTVSNSCLQFEENTKMSDFHPQCKDKVAV